MVFNKNNRTKEQLNTLYSSQIQEIMLVCKNDMGKIPLKEALIDEDKDINEIMTIADQYDDVVD
ncbi:MAG: hypothetical protein RR642_10325 [Solibacillus sp.]